MLTNLCGDGSMKSFLLAALVLTPTAQAEMIECPAQYPAKETTLAGYWARTIGSPVVRLYAHWQTA